MRRFARLLSAACFALAPLVAQAADRIIVDGAGRSVEVPEAIAHVLPAGPPADVLLFALAPDLLIGLVEPFPESKKPLVPQAFRDLARVPRLSREPATADIDTVEALKPDVIIDYGDIAPRYVDAADAISAATGFASLLFDGRLAQTPQTVRAVAHLLARDARGEAIAKAAEAVLAELKPLADLAPEQRVPVYYARGGDGLQAIRPGTILDEALALAGGRNVVPAGGGAFATLTADAVAKLAPKVVVVADPAAMAPGSALRAALPADTRFLADPGVPFGWIEAPPSLNRLIGAAWLASKLYPDRVGFDAARAKAMLHDVLGIDPTDAQIAAMLQ